MRSLICLLSLLALLVVLPGAAVAAPPANDDFASATLVPSLPFADSVDITDATRTFDEPVFGCYGAPQHTVWYVLTTPAAAMIRIRGASSSIPDVSLGVFRDEGSGISGLGFVGCGSGPSPEIPFAATAGSTYYVQVGTSFSTTGVIDLSIAVLPPPANDDVANAKAVTFPFAETVDVSAASVEPLEPVPSCFYTGGNSVWYKLAPTADTSVTVTVGATDLTTTAVYTGTPPAGLTEIDCRTYSGPLTFRAHGGATTYIRVAAFGPRTVDVAIDRAPAPVADFTWYPEEPSIFDEVQLFSASVDPGGAPARSFAWSFGDGTHGVDCCVGHRFARDGDYRVTLTFETLDGRMASVTKVVSVRTHDVVVRKVEVPASAKVGTAKTITVEVENARYPEDVEVQLFRTRPGAFGTYELIGTRALPIRARKGGSTPFKFTYTLDAGDALAGKVSFMATARILGHIDALPGDNQMTSAVVKVTR